MEEIIKEAKVSKIKIAIDSVLSTIGIGIPALIKDTYEPN